MFAWNLHEIQFAWQAAIQENKNDWTYEKWKQQQI